MKPVAILSFTLLILLSISCKKTEDDKRYLADGLVTYQFKPGSYWVYEDDLSGELDSHYVDDSWQTWCEVSYFEEHYFEAFYVHIEQSSGSNYTWKLRNTSFFHYTSMLDMENGDCGHVDTCDYFSIWVHPGNMGEPPYSLSGCGTYVTFEEEMYPTFSAGGNTFENVSEYWASPQDPTADLIDVKIFISDIGVVKWEERNPDGTLLTSRSLKRWNVIK